MFIMFYRPSIYRAETLTELERSTGNRFYQYLMLTRSILYKSGRKGYADNVLGHCDSTHHISATYLLSAG